MGKAIPGAKLAHRTRIASDIGPIKPEFAVEVL